MGSVINDQERYDCYDCAIQLAQEGIRAETGFVHPKTPVGELSPWEWGKIAQSLISGWIVERSKQMSLDRGYQEPEFLAMGEEPEPFEVGAFGAILPQLADFIESRGLSDQPIGGWGKLDILHFLWLASKLKADADTARHERPGRVEEVDLLMAG